MITRRRLRVIGAVPVLVGLLSVVTLAGEPRGRHPRRSRASSRSNGATLYERVDARLRRDPKLAERLGSPPAELDAVTWMLGSWTVEARVFATRTSPERVSKGRSEVRPAMQGHWLEITDTYEDGGVDESYMTYSVSTNEWLSVTLHAGGIVATSRAKAWSGDRLVFLLPNVSILGERVTLRQTVERRGADEYHVLNEERLPNGRYVALDEYTYRRTTASE